MPLTGRSPDGEVDFPRTVKESVTVLPFKTGGTTTLDTAGTRENLVAVGDLRRFENDVIAAGTHTGSGNASTLTDSAADFLAAGVQVGDLLTNTTDNSSGTVTGVTATTISVTLAGGTDDDFDNGDAYTVTAQGSHDNARATEIRDVEIATDLECFVKFDGDASSGDHDVHLEAGESYSKAGVRIVSRISILNVIGSETPEVRFTVWGV